MCQQTQIDTVLPYFTRWMRLFPDFKTLAQAEESIVLKQWEGLGYYSRARNLHRLAKDIAQLEAIPSTAKEWEQFPGIGHYTAAAITSIVFGTEAACVDGNVVRILSRITACEEEFKDGATAAKKFKPLAEKFFDPKHPGKHNQAMMELGATLCFRRKPLCTVCPVLEFCTAGRRGDAENFPRLTPKVTVKVTVNRLWLQQNGSLLLHKAPTGSKRLAELYELPTADGLIPQPSPSNLLVEKKRGIGNQRITERIFRANLTQKLKSRVNRDDDLHWLPIKKIHTITLSGPHRKWISELLTDLAG